VKKLIVNGTECEAYLSSDHRILLEKSAEVVGGAKILMKALGSEKAVFAIADDKEDGAEEILKAIRNTPVFSIALFRAKYPQGDERLLVEALMGKEIPAGKAAWDVGAVVIGVQTCRAVYQAFVTGMPQITRCLTVGGECIKEGANLSVPLGSSFAQVIARCGGVLKTPKLLLAGGPMRGIAQGTDQVCVTKTVSGILCLDYDKKAAGPCIHCGRCARVCPMGLLPLELHRASVGKKIARLRLYRADVCNECGCCAYSCPSRIELVAGIRHGKALLEAEGEGRK
jgi:electron transport complex protein RnfC